MGMMGWHAKGMSEWGTPLTQAEIDRRLKATPGSPDSRPNSAQRRFTPAGTLANARIQAALEAVDAVKVPKGGATPYTDAVARGVRLRSRAASPDAATYRMRPMSAPGRDAPSTGAHGHLGGAAGRPTTAPGGGHGRRPASARGGTLPSAGQPLTRDGDADLGYPQGQGAATTPERRRRRPGFSVPGSMPRQSQSLIGRPPGEPSAPLTASVEPRPVGTRGEAEELAVLLEAAEYTRRLEAAVSQDLYRALTRRYPITGRGKEEVLHASRT